MSDNMSDRARQLKNEYYRNWRKKNKDKVQEANHRYWERKAEQMQSERKCNEDGKNEI